MKASVVIPSYNACERLYYNLLSLEMQDIDKNEFEVIVIDNGSKDDTYEFISEHCPDINLKWIRCLQNQGRSKARNLGIQEAQGDIIIFSDSDMISSKDFVSRHIDMHKIEHAVVCGVNWDKIYTFYYKDFKGKMLKRFLEIQSKYNPSLKLRDLKDKDCLIDKESILNGKYITQVFYHGIQENNYKRDIGLVGNEINEYCFPWRFFITNNCSVKKANIIKAGLFDESFEGWGCEDLDLGFRLYRNGCSFIKADIQSIHQEHPARTGDEGQKNIFIFTEKYDSSEILLFYFCSFITYDRWEVNRIILDLQRLEKHTKNTLLIFLFRDMLKIVRDRELKAISDKGEIYHKSKKIKDQLITQHKRIGKQLTELELNDGFSGFAAAFRRLSEKLFGIIFNKGE